MVSLLLNAALAMDSRPTNGFRCSMRPGKQGVRHSVDEGFIACECRPDVQDVMAAVHYAVRRLRSDPVVVLLALSANSGTGLSKTWRQLLEGERGSHLILDGLPPPPELAQVGARSVKPWTWIAVSIARVVRLGWRIAWFGRFDVAARLGSSCTGATPA